MSLSADIADAIIAVDKATSVFEDVIDRDVRESDEWLILKAKIEDLMEASLGEGMHFSSLEEARAFRQPVAPEGHHLCVQCDKPIPNGRGFGIRCGDCMDPKGSA